MNVKAFRRICSLNWDPWINILSSRLFFGVFILQRMGFVFKHWLRRVGWIGRVVLRIWNSNWGCVGNNWLWNWSWIGNNRLWSSWGNISYYWFWNNGWSCVCYNSLLLFKWYWHFSNRCSLSNWGCNRWSNFHYRSLLSWSRFHCYRYSLNCWLLRHFFRSCLQ